MGSGSRGRGRAGFRAAKGLGRAGVLALALTTVTGAHAQTPAEAEGRPAILDDLAAYLGTWTSESRTAADGRSFHFVYDVTWYDQGKSMVEIGIVQRFADGEDRVLWKGFKGWDRLEGGAYYQGFSPGGRVARGTVYTEGADLVTEYQGWGPTGPVVRIRDVFSPVADGHFLAVTLMHRDGDWHEIMRDTWTRTARAG